VSDPRCHPPEAVPGPAPAGGAHAQCSMCGRVSRLIEERRVRPSSEHRISVAEVTRFYACANPACEIRRACSVMEERARLWAASVEHEVMRRGVRTTDWRRFNLTAILFPDKGLRRRRAGESVWASE
jgi:hypothetical protein